MTEGPDRKLEHRNVVVEEPGSAALPDSKGRSMTRKALVIGVDDYTELGPLKGCVNDATAVATVLRTHDSGAPNFGVRTLTGKVSKKAISTAAAELFGGDDDIALVYFAGHGHVEATGGYLLGSDARDGDDGMPVANLMTLANASRARNRVIVLDSCHSGVAGAHPIHRSTDLFEGVTILTASTAEQYATEENGRGTFTDLFVDALDGAGANLVGDITPGAVYAHVDQSLGPWQQRPVFKTNVKQFVSLRRARAPIPIADLSRLSELFPAAGHVFALDPSYEPEPSGRTAADPQPDPAHTAIFAILQRYNRVNLVVPVDAPHMWHAAMQSKGCRLTVLGRHYRRLVAQRLI